MPAIPGHEPRHHIVCGTTTQLNATAPAVGSGSWSTLNASATIANANNSNKQINFSRYKTELCRQFSENGECKYGDKCQFAHGVADLKDVNKPDTVHHISIKLKSDKLKALYKNIRKKLIYVARKWFITGCTILNEMLELIKKDIFNKPEYETFIKDRKQQNLYECVQWAKKYDMPLAPHIDFNKFTESFKHQIFRDIVTYEKDVVFKFKSDMSNYSSNMANLLDNLFPNNNIEYTDIPNYFNTVISKFLLETRALDYRDLAIYKEINLKVDYYQKKLTKVITHKYNLYDGFITQAWFKMTEMLHKFKLVDYKHSTSMKSFHICELPGAFIKALEFYIKQHTNIINWQWSAQSLNPSNNNLDTPDRIQVAFGDDAGLLRKHRKNYDFGPLNTGDITDPVNIEYYRKKYNHTNDFITADCGLSSEYKHLSGKLAYSTFLLIFATLKQGGNCLIKRILPIDNQQEIILLYIFYLSFEKMHFYKPRVNYQSPEYYVIGLNYKPISEELYEKLLEFLKNYNKVGLVKLDNIVDLDDFLLQLDKAQHNLIDNLNDFIRKKIYFADNVDKLTSHDWIYINKGIKDKIGEWLTEFRFDKHNN
jgi:23S rRNA U2552 (ribose-2'-O)-methylase RlmE/FtsJ